MTIGKLSNLGLTIGTSLLIGGCATKQNNDVFIIEPINSTVTNYYSNNINNVITKNNSNEIIIQSDKNNKLTLSERKELEKINRSIEIIGEKEFKYFKQIFNIKNNKDYIKVISNIQNDNGLKSDNIIGVNTLKIIYLQYYSKFKIEDLPFDIKKRLEIYNEMEGYKNHKGKGSKYGKLLPTKVPDLFNKNYFYGIGTGENIEGTFINNKLSSLVYKTVKEPGNISILFENDGKYIVAVYINHKLELLSYTSPGNNNIKGGIKTRLGQFTTTKSDKYYISSARDSIKRTNEGLKGAIMPYALHINGGIYAHAGYVTGDRKSHGCVRLPILYAKGLYDIYQKNGNIDWNIKNN